MHPAARSLCDSRVSCLSFSNLLNPRQSAYCKHHSTETALLYIHDQLINAIYVLCFLPRCMECRRGLAMRILSVRQSVRLSLCLSVCTSVCHTREL